jgi:hypothetical protein
MLLSTSSHWLKVAESSGNYVSCFTHTSMLPPLASNKKYKKDDERQKIFGMLSLFLNGNVSKAWSGVWLSKVHLKK